MNFLNDNMAGLFRIENRRNFEASLKREKRQKNISGNNNYNYYICILIGIPILYLYEYGWIWWASNNHEIYIMIFNQNNEMPEDNSIHNIII